MFCELLGGLFYCFQKKYFFMAEREGFEPSMQVLPACSLSRGVPSTTRPSLRSDAGDIIAQLENFRYPRPKALWRARTASSMYFSSITTEILISEVEII